MFSKNSAMLKMNEVISKVNEQVEVISHTGQEKMNEIESKVNESKKDKQEIMTVVNEIHQEIWTKLTGTKEKVYFGTSQQENITRFYDIKQTLNGVATFYLTNDGTKNGKALFNHIAAINPTPIHMTDKSKEIPLCSIKCVSPDNRTVEVNVVKGSYNLVILGGYMDSMKFVQDGVLICIEVVGK